MTRLAALLALALSGCVHLPDRMIVSYQRDPDTADEKLGVALSFPLTWPNPYRPLFESNGYVP